MSPSSSRVPVSKDLNVVMRDRQTTSEVLAAALRERLVAGEYPPGALMRESVLAPELGVSRPTVREALQHLVREGLLTYQLNRGMFVTELGADDVRDLYLTRVVLETAGVAAAAGAGGTVDTSAVRAASDTFEEAAARGDGLAVVDADMAFHTALVGLVGSARLVEFHRSVAAQLRLALGQLDVADGDLAAQAREHRKLARLLERGKYDALDAKLREHLGTASDRLVAFLEARSA